MGEEGRTFAEIESEKALIRALGVEILRAVFVTGRFDGMDRNFGDWFRWLNEIAPARRWAWIELDRAVNVYRQSGRPWPAGLKAFDLNRPRKPRRTDCRSHDDALTVFAAEWFHAENGLPLFSRHHDDYMRTVPKSAIGQSAKIHNTAYKNAERDYIAARAETRADPYRPPWADGIERLRAQEVAEPDDHAVEDRPFREIFADLTAQWGRLVAALRHP